MLNVDITANLLLLFLLSVLSGPFRQPHLPSSRVFLTSNAQTLTVLYCEMSPVYLFSHENLQHVLLEQSTSIT